MGTAAMDALKYGSYMSGLYGTMATSSTTSTDPTNTTSNSGQPGNKSPYMQQQELSPNDKGYPESNNGSASSASLKGNYTADSLSRSYFDAQQRYNEAAAKSYTPDSLNGGRASADSPDAMKQQPMMQHQQQTADLQQQTAVPQQQQMGFNSLQAYYSQHGMGAAAAATTNVTPTTAGPGSLPPFLPMAAQLSQYSVAASAAASAAAAANPNYPQSTPPGGANSEYRRPLSVLF